MTPSRSVEPPRRSAGRTLLTGRISRGRTVREFIIGVLLAIEFFVVGWLGRRSGVAEKVFRVEVAIWAMIVGVLGVVVLGAVRREA